MGIDLLSAIREGASIQDVLRDARGQDLTSSERDILIFKIEAVLGKILSIPYSEREMSHMVELVGLYALRAALVAEGPSQMLVDGIWGEEKSLSSGAPVFHEELRRPIGEQLLRARMKNLSESITSPQEVLGYLEGDTNFSRGRPITSVHPGRIMTLIRYNMNREWAEIPSKQIGDIPLGVETHELCELMGIRLALGVEHSVGEYDPRTKWMYEMEGERASEDSPSLRQAGETREIHDLLESGQELWQGLDRPSDDEDFIIRGFYMPPKGLPSGPHFVDIEGRALRYYNRRRSQEEISFLQGWMVEPSYADPRSHSEWVRAQKELKEINAWLNPWVKALSPEQAEAWLSPWIKRADQLGEVRTWLGKPTMSVGRLKAKTTTPFWAVLYFLILRRQELLMRVIPERIGGFSAWENQVEKTPWMREKVKWAKERGLLKVTQTNTGKKKYLIPPDRGVQVDIPLHLLKQALNFIPEGAYALRVGIKGPLARSMYYKAKER